MHCLEASEAHSIVLDLHLVLTQSFMLWCREREKAVERRIPVDDERERERDSTSIGQLRDSKSAPQDKRKKNGR